MLLVRVDRSRLALLGRTSYATWGVLTPTVPPKLGVIIDARKSPWSALGKQKMVQAIGCRWRYSSMRPSRCTRRWSALPHRTPQVGVKPHGPAKSPRNALDTQTMEQAVPHRGGVPRWGSSQCHLGGDCPSVYPSDLVPAGRTVQIRNGGVDTLPHVVVHWSPTASATIPGAHFSLHRTHMTLAVRCRIFSAWSVAELPLTTRFKYL